MKTAETRKFIHGVLNDLTKLDIRIKIIRDILKNKTELSSEELKIAEHIEVLDSNIESICKNSKDWKASL